MSIQTAPEIRMNLDALTYAHKVWESLDTAVSLSCHLLARAGEYKQLVSKTIDALSYVDPYSFFLDYQSVKLLSKYPYLETGIDTKAAAIEKFVWAEEQCRLTNDRFRQRESGLLFGDRVERVLSVASRKISSILGDVPSYERMDFGFGPGAAYGVRRETSVYNKVTAALECTYALVPLLPEFLEEFPGWIPEGIHDVNVIQGSELAFVPKDAKTDRPICIEPLLNGFYQKGFGTWIRKRLRSHGINLNDQSVNQKLAQRAFTDNLATVDFSSASDTVAYLLVLDLLPIDWFKALEAARSPKYRLDGVWKDFHKFTSMGNAYTFELETLLFYALAYACCEELGLEVKTGVNLSVYGDDVIIPQEAFDLYSEVTEICGFTVNKDKSFFKGQFFESCGCDFFIGELVRPFLLKKRINTLLPAFYAANTLKRIKARIPSSDGTLHNHRERVLGRLDHVHAWVISRIPRDLRVMGPEGYGDGHIVSELDVAVTSRPSRVTRHRPRKPGDPGPFDAWCFRSYTESPIRRAVGEWPLAYALYQTRDQGEIWLAHLKEPASADSSRGYTVRGHTRVRNIQILCHGEWRGPSDNEASSPSFDWQKSIVDASQRKQGD